MAYLKSIKTILTVIGFVLLGVLTVFFIKSGLALREIIIEAGEKDVEKVIVNPYDNFKPYYDPEHLNILVLGIRGAGDKNGGLLSDAMLVVSIDKTTKKTALVSIPRDLYVLIPGESINYGKINTAYAIGESRKWNGGGMILSKSVVEFVTGLKFDHVVSFDFEAFEETVDILGGIEINLKEDFVEKSQWHLNAEFAESGGAFMLPKGQHTLDGKTALFYIRSRFSSSDFDRGRRIQEIVTAIREKAQLGWLKNPSAVFQFLDTIGDHVKTDMTFKEISDLVQGVGNYYISQNLVLSIATPALLVESTIENQYVLLPYKN